MLVFLVGKINYLPSQGQWHIEHNLSHCSTFMLIPSSSSTSASVRAFNAINTIVIGILTVFQMTTITMWSYISPHIKSGCEPWNEHVLCSTEHQKLQLDKALWWGWRVSLPFSFLSMRLFVCTSNCIVNSTYAEAKSSVTLCTGIHAMQTYVQMSHSITFSVSYKKPICLPFTLLSRNSSLQSMILHSGDEGLCQTAKCRRDTGGRRETYVRL